MTIEQSWFEDYLAAFNANDYDKFGAYYAEDIEFLGLSATLRGRDTILDFYRGVEKRLVEKVDLISFVASDTMIAAEIRVTLDPLEDWPDFGPSPLVKGERKQSLVFLFYDVADGQFTRIRSARFRRIEQG